MGRTSCRKRALLLLGALFLLLMSSAPSSPEVAAFRQANALCDRGDWNAAAQTIDESLRRFPDSDADAIWALRVLRALPLTALTQYAQARQALALTLPPRLAHSETAVRRLMYDAIAAYRLHAGDEAFRLLDQAEQMAVTHQPQLRGEVAFRRANLLFNQKQDAAGESAARQALRFARRYKQRNLEARVHATLAILHTNQQHYDEAVEENERALAMARPLAMDSLIEKAEGNLAWAYLELGDVDAASSLFESAAATAQKIGAGYDVVAWLNQLGSVRRERHDLAGAMRFYGQALEAAERVKHPARTIILTNMAKVGLARGDYDEARRNNRRAHELERNDPDQDDELRSQLLDAQIDAATHRYDEARATYQRVLASGKSKSILWETHGRLGELYAANGHGDEAAEQFRLAIQAADEARDTIDDPELKLAFPHLVREFVDAYIDLLVAGGHVAEGLEVAEQTRARTLAEGLGLTAKEADVDPRHVAGDASATILAYWLASPRSFVWIVTPTTISVVALPAGPSIDDAIDAYQRELLGPRGGISERGQQLYAMLLAPATRSMKAGGRLVIVPDGRMHVFNVETLVVPTPKPHYFIEDAIVTTASSIDLLGRAPALSRSTARSLLLVGNAPSPDRAFPPLPRAGAELRDVAAHFDRAQLLLLEGAAATPAAYRGADAERFSYLHFVAHGVASRQRPLDSAVVLARSGDEYKLYARDIVKQKLRARLVTISSCHGAGARAYAGEGLVGLAWAFLRAGAHQVIAALWEVNDNATPELMDRMYAELGAGRDPATALHDAKLTLVRSNGIYRKPRYWAPFMLYSGS